VDSCQLSLTFSFKSSKLGEVNPTLSEVDPELTIRSEILSFVSLVFSLMNLSNSALCEILSSGGKLISFI